MAGIKALINAGRNPSPEAGNSIAKKKKDDLRV